MRPRAALFTLLTLGFLLRVVMIELRPAEALENGPDEDEYLELARNVAHGHGFQMHGAISAYRDMLFPVTAAGVMTIFGDSPRPVLFLNALLSCATAYMLYLLGRKRFGETIGVIMAGAWVFYTGAALFAALFFTETLCMFWWVLALVLYDHLEARSFDWKIAFAMGMVSGFAALTRGAALVVPASLVIYITLIRYEVAAPIRWRAASVLIMGCLLITLPWMLRNKMAIGEFALNTNGGINMFIGFNADANGAYKFTTEQESQLPPTGEGEAEIDRAAKQLAWDYACENPQAALSLLGRKFAFLWATDASQWVYYLWERGTTSLAVRLRGLPVWMLLFLALPYMAITGCGVSGYYLVRHFPDRGLFILQVFLIVLTVFLSHGEPRYHVAAMPALIVGMGALVRPQVWNAAPLLHRLILLFTLGMFVGIWLFEGMAIYGYVG